MPQTAPQLVVGCECSCLERQSEDIFAFLPYILLNCMQVLCVQVVVCRLLNAEGDACLVFVGYLENGIVGVVYPISFIPFQSSKQA